jgi:hypothetical protein
MKKHKHHIVPRHAGGSDGPSNIIELTIHEHAEAHRLLYEQFGRWQDRVAWLSLAGIMKQEERIYEILKNSNPGGWKPTKEQLIKLSESKKGVKNPMFGKIASNRGVKRPGVGGRKKGTKWSDSERKSQELAKLKPGRYDYLKTENRSERYRGENNPNFGKPGATTGKKTYHNGLEEKFFVVGKQEDGFVLGRLPGSRVGIKKGLRWYNDGIVNKQYKEGQQPEGFVNGRTRKKQ